jgi:prepilin-type processing-associated H-X9-DG protein
MGPSDASSVWRCQAASNVTFPAGSTTAAVTYVMNLSISEQSEGIIKESANMYLVREMDRLLNSVCRPTNGYLVGTGGTSVGQPGTAPLFPLLAANNNGFSSGTVVQNKLHGTGSHVLFTDGHVKQFPAQYFPLTYSYSQSWDTETSQWYNFRPGYGSVPTALRGSIVITPPAGNAPQ